MSARTKPARTERHAPGSRGGGDERAFDELYAHCARATFGLLLQVLGDRRRAAEVQEQVFHEAWRRGARCDADRAGLLTRVLTIARGHATAELHRASLNPGPAGRGAAATATGRAPADPLADRRDGPTPEALPLGPHRLTGLLHRLPARERDVLRLRYGDGLTVGQIARRTGVSPDTAQDRAAAGLERLLDHGDATQAA